MSLFFSFVSPSFPVVGITGYGGQARRQAVTDSLVRVYQPKEAHLTRLQENSNEVMFRTSNTVFGAESLEIFHRAFFLDDTEVSLQECLTGTL